MNKILFFVLILLAYPAQVYAGAIQITNKTKEPVTINYKHLWMDICAQYTGSGAALPTEKRCVMSGDSQATIKAGEIYKDEKMGVWFGNISIVQPGYVFQGLDGPTDKRDVIEGTHAEQPGLLILYKRRADILKI